MLVYSSSEVKNKNKLPQNKNPKICFKTKKSSPMLKNLCLMVKTFNQTLIHTGEEEERAHELFVLNLFCNFICSLKSYGDPMSIMLYTEI